jgi:hypothetical protein
MTLLKALKRFWYGVFWPILAGVISSLIASYIVYHFHLSI